MSYEIYLRKELRKTNGFQQDPKVALRLKQTETGSWEATESMMDRIMDPMNDLDPNYDSSFERLLRAAVCHNIKEAEKKHTR